MTRIKWKNLGTSDGITIWTATINGTEVGSMARHTPRKEGQTVISGRGGFPSTHTPMIQDRAAPKLWTGCCQISGGRELEWTMAPGLPAAAAKKAYAATLELRRPELFTLPQPKPPARKRISITLPPALHSWVQHLPLPDSAVIQTALELLQDCLAEQGLELPSPAC